VLGDAGQTADLWAFQLHGAARRLTHSSSWYSGPSIAPDGGTVAYVKQDAWGSNVYAVPFAGGAERPVTSDSGSRQVVRWLPGGRQISAIVLARGAAGSITQEVSGLETGLRRVVKLDAGLVIVAWMPDRTALAERIDYRGLAVVDSTGRTLRALPFADSLGTLGGLALAPDGREAAVVTSRPGLTRVYAMRLADGAVRRVMDLAPETGVHRQLARWATDSYLYFSRVMGVGQPELWRVPVRGGALARYSALPVACNQGTISLSSDAQAGACLVYDNRPDLWLVERK
jgi:Tol biopolymer transport system component